MCPKSQRKGKVSAENGHEAKRPECFKVFLGFRHVGICADLLMKHLSRVVKTDNSKLRMAWEVRRQMHASP